MSITEIAGFIFGIVGVWLTIRENAWCFPVGILNVTISFFLFKDQQLYADALQQVVYFILLSYGWFQWSKGISTPSLKITGINFKWTIILLPATVTLAVLMGYLFDRYTDAALPYWDSSATAICFTAQFLVALKKLENWHLWIVANCMYIGIYIQKELFLYSILFLIYLILAFYGLVAWKKQQSTQT